ALRDVNVGAEDAAHAGIVWPFLRPVEFLELWIDGDSDAPPHLIAHVLVATTSLDQRFDLRAVEICAHDAHALTVAPIELAGGFLEVHLLRRIGATRRNNDFAVLAVEVGALDRTVVEVGDAHIGPIDMTRGDIYRDAVGQTAVGDDGLAVGAVGIHRVN